MPISSEEIGELYQSRDSDEIVEAVKAEDEISGVGRTRRSHIWVIVIVAVVCVVVAIVIGLLIWWFLRRPGGSDSGKDIGSSCTSDTDCLAGLQCSAFLCKVPPNGQCSNTNQCSLGLACHSGRCN